MQKFEKVLFFYSILVSVILFTGSFFIFPTPVSFFAMGLFLPITLYFIFKISLSNEENPYSWSLKFMITLITVSLLGLLSFYISKKQDQKREESIRKQTISSLNKDEEIEKGKGMVLGETESKDLEETIKEINEQLAQIKAEQKLIREILELTDKKENVLEILEKILEATSSASINQ